MAANKDIGAFKDIAIGSRLKSLIFSLRNSPTSLFYVHFENFILKSKYKIYQNLGHGEKVVGA